MNTPFWNAEHCREIVLKECNNQQPAWKPILRYDQLTPAQQSIIDVRAEELEFAVMLLDMPDGDDTFSIHALRRDESRDAVNYLSYTVNNTNTTSLERACELLQEIERKQKQHVTDMLRAEKVGR